MKSILFELTDMAIEDDLIASRILYQDSTYYRRKQMLKRTAASLAAIILLCLLTGNAFSELIRKQSQTVYVSAYPHVFMGPRGTDFELGITLLIRNTDFKSPVTITSVDYYDTQGKLTKKYLSGPLSLAPMASKEIHITEKDSSGGMGSNFIVRWKSDKEVNVPLIETVMIGGKGGQGISFVSPGREISE